MPALLVITHITRYDYDRPVSFGEHRLLVRPRDGHDLRVIEASLQISPAANLRWNFDAFGNSVALAVFSEPADHLEIRSELLIKRYAQETTFLGDSNDRARMPLVYTDEDSIDLAPFIQLEFPQERAALMSWLDQEFDDRPAEIMAFLRALSAKIHASFGYLRREESGTQTALETLSRKSGTCRDFAFFFMECARIFGFASRFVTGYLHVRADMSEPFTGGGSTHAWADVYIPGEGWIEFDPTNLIDDNQALIRIAVTRTPLQAIPISGTYERADARFLGMSVVVSVREIEEEPSA